MKKIIILTIITFLMSGCSYVELNDLAIVSAIGIDYEDDEFKLTAQIMDVKSNDGGMTEENTLIYEANGKTIAKAMRNFSIRYPKNVYLGHLEFIIINSDTTIKKIDDIFDYFMRSPEVRSLSYITLTKDEKAKDILNPKNESKGSFPIEGLKTVLLDATKRNGTIYDLTLEELLSFYLKKGIDPVVPLIKSSNKKGITASATIIEELAPLKNKKVLKSLDTKQSIAYNTINNNYYDIVINCKYKNKDFSALLYNPKSSLDLKLKDGKPEVNINIKLESKIIETDNKINLTKSKNQKEIKKLVNKEIKKYINSLIDYSKENNADVLGLGNMIYKNYFKDYNKYKNKNVYELAKFNIKIDNKMYRYGNINKGAV